MTRMPNRNKFSFLLPAFLVFTLSSCLGPRKVDKWVARYYNENPAPAFSKPISGVKLSSPLSSAGQALSVTEKSSKVLPLLFYWKWNVDNHCTLNPAIPLGHFANGLSTEARTLHLVTKMNGKTIEASIEQIPRLLNLNDDGWLVWVLLFYVGGESIAVGPEDGELRVNWHFVENGTSGKNHLFTLTQEARPLFVKYMQSTRRTSWRSLKAYDDRIEKLGRQFADEIAQRLED